MKLKWWGQNWFINIAIEGSILTMMNKDHTNWWKWNDKDPIDIFRPLFCSHIQLIRGTQGPLCRGVQHPCHAPSQPSIRVNFSPKKFYLNPERPKHRRITKMVCCVPYCTTDPRVLIREVKWTKHDKATWRGWLMGWILLFAFLKSSTDILVSQRKIKQINKLIN